MGWKINLSEREEKFVREYADTYTIAQMLKMYHFHCNANQLKLWCDNNGVPTRGRKYFPNENEMKTCTKCGQEKPTYRFPYIASLRRSICLDCVNKKKHENRRKNLRTTTEQK